MIQFVSMPLYVASRGSKIRKFALTITEIGAPILKGEVGIVNWGWIGVDLALFGEPVLITENVSFLAIDPQSLGSLTATYIFTL